MLTRVVSGLVIGLALVASRAMAATADDPQAARPPGAAQAAAGEHGGGAPAGQAQPQSGQPEHGAGAINPLEFKSDLAIWTAVVFLVLLALLWKFAWGPIIQGLESREKRIADQIAHAEQSNRDARQLLDEYQQKLAGSQDEVRAIIDQGRRDAEHLAGDLLQQARVEVRREHEHALRDIDVATAGALKELAERSAALAVELAGKIVRTQLSADDHAELIRQAVANIAEAKPSHN